MKVRLGGLSTGADSAWRRIQLGGMTSNSSIASTLTGERASRECRHAHRIQRLQVISSGCP
jgi:hypothetical protein